MVAVIKTGRSLRRIFHYNEQKVEQGVAECIMAENYPKDISSLSLSQRLHRLLRQAALNENVTRNSVHISLNFHPSERLVPEQMQDIARAYMEGIGFGEQPYLVYSHRDAGHPHLHIVSVKVRADGSRIDLHNIGRGKASRVRKEIEQRFGLVKAQGLGKGYDAEQKPAPVRLVSYGQSETRLAIEQVLQAVVPHFRYTSFPELNAVLGLYRVMADRGSEESRLYRHRGLVYRVLDGEGQPVGVPLKASAFHTRATLAALEHRFRQNSQARLPYKARLKNRITLALLQQPRSLPHLQQMLEKAGIHLVLRQNAAGRVYGMTYVDLQSKCIFNGSDLGKGFSVRSVLLGIHGQTREQPTCQACRQALDLVRVPGSCSPPASRQAKGGLAELLLQPAPVPDFVPYALRLRRKKKRKRLMYSH